MQFIDMPLGDAFTIKGEPASDKRGSFTRIFCAREFTEMGIASEIAQCSISRNPRTGTLRGMHFQVEPAEEHKLVICVQGAVYDVLVDLRPDSSTYCKWFGAELTADDHSMLYIPPGVAHGFQTLVDDSTLFYAISPEYSAEHARGVRWDDPAFGIDWPEAEWIISERDRSWPNFQP